MKKLLVSIVALLVTACSAPAPSSALPSAVGVVAPQFSLEDANATATGAAREIRSTEWAETQVYEQRTAEAFAITQTSAAIGYTQTVAAATPTAAALSITMTTDAGNATSAAVSTITYAGAAYIATATQIAGQSERDKNLREFEANWRIVVISFWVTVIACTAIISFTLWLWINRYGRARVVRERYEVLDAAHVFDRSAREIIPMGAAQADSDDPDVIKWRKAWYQAIHDAAYIAAISGGWTIDAMCRQYPEGERPITEDDWQTIVGWLVQVEVLAEGRGQKGTNYAPGQSIITLTAQLDNNEIPLPPYSANPAPVVDISRAQRNATQKRNAKRRAETV